jgi:poly(3-hydroxybutyrate) depolymerase
LVLRQNTRLTTGRIFIFDIFMWRLLILLLSLAAAPAVAQPQAIAIPAHPGEQAVNGPATLNAVLWQPAGRGPHAAIVLMHGCTGMNTSAGQP